MKIRRPYEEENKDPTEGGAASSPAPETPDDGAIEDDESGAPAAGGDTPADPPAPAKDERSDDEKATAEFLKGVTEASPKKDEAAAPAAAPAPAAKDGDGKKPEAAAPAPAPAPDKDLDKEVKDLGLKGAAEKRFRDMSTEIKTSRPLMGELEKVGVKSVEDLNAVIGGARRNLEWETALENSTATGEQVASAFTVIRAMNTGDPKLMNAAYDALIEQVGVLGKKLGREVPGHDPLDDHPDLKQGVEDLALTREHALELVRSRAAAKQDQANAEARAAAAKNDTEQQAAYDGAVEDAKKELAGFQAEMEANDPQAAQKMPVLVDMLNKGLLKDIHPSRWAGKVATEYAKLRIAQPAAAPAAPRPAVGAQPMRGGGRPTAVMDDNNQDGINPFLRGVAAASPSQ